MCRFGTLCLNIQEKSRKPQNNAQYVMYVYVLWMGVFEDVYACMYVYVCMDLYVCRDVYVCTFVCLYVCLCFYVCVCLYACNACAAFLISLEFHLNRSILV